MRGFFIFLLLASWSPGFTTPPRDSEPKIYDCFPFFNEFEILEVRLNELSDGVDYFVLVEAKQTFSGKPKPLYFEENKHLFAPFLDRIIHVVVPEANRPKFTNWDREKLQRNQIMKGLENCQPNDVILISDVDEIPRAAVIPQIAKIIAQKQGPVACSQTIYRFNFNRHDPAYWTGTIGISYRDLRRIKPEQARSSKGHYWVIPDGGWHFTSFGGYARYCTKIESYSHADVMDFPYYKDMEVIKQTMEMFQWVPIDETYPAFVRENLVHFQNNGFIEPKPGG